MVDPHGGQHAMPLEDPVNLLLLAPHQIPVIPIGLFPLSVGQARVDAVLEGSLEFYIAGMIGEMLFLYVSAEVLRHFYYLYEGLFYFFNFLKSYIMDIEIG